MTEIDRDLKIFRSSLGYHCFVSDGSRVYDLDAETAKLLESTPTKDALLLLGIDSPTQRRFISDEIPRPDVRAISLNVAQACNMGCIYCYADEGRFGGLARVMDLDTAMRIIDSLFSHTTAGDLLIGFMGGEPLLNRRVLRGAVEYATKIASSTSQRVRFSVTTNATLMTEEDAAFFSVHPFSVQVSIDGAEFLQNSQRPMLDGSNSFEHVFGSLTHFTRVRPLHLSARATVTSAFLNIVDTMDFLSQYPFDDVGFGFAFTSRREGSVIDRSQYGALLEQLKACSARSVQKWKAREWYPFGNLLTAIRQIHNGTHRPYPCGAGATYLSADTAGEFFACHRFVGDREMNMGNITAGFNHDARVKLLELRHVDKQEPCRSCWARYVCGGGCHYEMGVLGRCEAHCDLIRGWIEECLKAYAELSSSDHAFLQL